MCRATRDLGHRTQSRCAGKFRGSPCCLVISMPFFVGFALWIFDAGPSGSLDRAVDQIGVRTTTIPFGRNPRRIEIERSSRLTGMHPEEYRGDLRVRPREFSPSWPFADCRPLPARPFDAWPDRRADAASGSLRTLRERRPLVHGEKPIRAAEHGHRARQGVLPLGEQEAVEFLLGPGNLTENRIACGTSPPTWPATA